MTDYENDIKEIKEILKKMQESIDKLERNSSVTKYSVTNSVSYGTELNTIPSTQACSEEELLKWFCNK